MTPSRKDLDAFCDKHTCCSCPIRHGFPFCGAGMYIGQESLGAREWAVMLIELDERTRREEGGEKNGND